MVTKSGVDALERKLLRSLFPSINPQKAGSVSANTHVLSVPLKPNRERGQKFRSDTKLRQGRGLKPQRELPTPSIPSESLDAPTHPPPPRRHVLPPVQPDAEATTPKALAARETAAVTAAGEAPRRGNRARPASLPSSPVAHPCCTHAAHRRCLRCRPQR